VVVLAFSDAILLRGVRTRHTVRDTRELKIAMQFVVFTTLARLNRLDFGIKETLNMSLKRIENLLNIRVVFQEINPAETRIVINKAHIILKTTRGSNGRSPNIRVN
jgi:hypothetical protein